MIKDKRSDCQSIPFDPCLRSTAQGQIRIYSKYRLKTGKEWKKFRQFLISRILNIKTTFER